MAIFVSSMFPESVNSALGMFDRGCRATPFAGSAFLSLSGVSAGEKSKHWPRKPFLRTSKRPGRWTETNGPSANTCPGSPASLRAAGVAKGDTEAVAGCPRRYMLSSLLSWPALRLCSCMCCCIAACSSRLAAIALLKAESSASTLWTTASRCNRKAGQPLVFLILSSPKDAPQIALSGHRAPAGS
jgi:hypothetical protein